MFKHVPTRAITEEEITALHNPTVSGEGNTGLIEAAYEDDNGDEDRSIDGASTRLEQLSKDLVSLSIVPKSRWQTLLQLELIRVCPFRHTPSPPFPFFNLLCSTCSSISTQQRNKPKEPPKAPEKAPFFLTSLDSSKQNSVPRKDDSVSAVSRIAKVTRDGLMERPFTSLLREGARTEDCKFHEPNPPLPSPVFAIFPKIPNTPRDHHSGTKSDENIHKDTTFITHLKSLPPSSADLEIRSLHPEELPHFIAALTARLQHKQDYELVQAWMTVFLRLHGDRIAHDPPPLLAQALREWRASQQAEATRLAALVGYCSGVLSFLRNPR